MTQTGRTTAPVLVRAILSLVGFDLFVGAVLVLFAFCAVFPLAGLDARFLWSAVPVWLASVGSLLSSGGYLGSVWVSATNKFAEPTVRIQSERGQTVISTGPYAIEDRTLRAGR